ncbi:hypothetical protein [Nitrosomonas communis]|uniref:hypothetical protein n=1 Tax=Nitrosomonas communis TaxID=44574 RepID=UPI003D27BB51
MRATVALRLVFRAVIFTALAKSAALSAVEPVKLTETQMDTVTAGTVAVGMGAWATAGDFNANTYTYTSTSTMSTSTMKSNVEIGLGFGNAVACCGSNPYTNVQTAYYAEGDRVSANSLEDNMSTPTFSYSYGYTSVIAVGVPWR